MCRWKTSDDWWKPQELLLEGPLLVPAYLPLETKCELLNDAIFGAIYYRFLLRSGPLTRRFGEELVKHILRGHRSEPHRTRSD